LKRIIESWCNEIYYKKNTEFPQQYQAINQEYNTFSKNTPYQIHPTAITTSKIIDTRQIVQLLQNTDQQQEALKLELKKIEKEIGQPLNNEQKELVNKFIQSQKKLIENKKDKEVRSETERLEEQLEENGFTDKVIKNITKYCKRLINLVHQLEKEEKLQTNIEMPANNK
jgi:hypothetical protein